jgi:two-component system cell cycle sensor histidine kinase/response regulator CckA
MNQVAPNSVDPLLKENAILAEIVATQQEVATAGIDRDDVMRVIAERTQSLIGADGVVVEFTDQEEMVYHTAAGSMAVALAPQLKLAIRLSALCGRSEDVLKCDDTETDSRVNREACRRVGVRSFVVVPLHYNGGVVGVLKILSSHPNAFGEREVNLLQLMAGLLAAALHNAQAFEKWRLTAADRAKALKDTEDRFAAFMNNSPAVAFIKDQQGRYVYVNKQFRELFHLEGDWFGKTDLDLWAPDVARHLQENDQQVLADRRSEMFEETVPTPDGIDRHWLVHKFPFTHEGRTALGGIAIEITEQKRSLEQLQRAKEELRRSERRYRSLVNATAQVVWVMSPEGVTTAVHGAEDFFGVSDVPVSVATWLTRTHPDDRERLEAAVANAVADWRPFQIEYRLFRADGQLRQVACRGLPVRDENGRVVEWVGVVDDLTDQRRLEEQYRQAQKMEAVGRFAGGIAHDFNNLLTVINGFADLLMTNLPPHSRNRQMAGEIRDAGDRAAGLTRQLLSFSRKQVLLPEVLNLNEIVEGAEILVRRLTGENVVLETHYDLTIPRMEADPSSVEQVIMNLVVNARDAMPMGGKLTMSTHVVDLALGETEERPGLYVELAVTDSGHGMTEEVKSQLFEPFFTTKDPGKGTGLGLAVVHGVVTQGGGHIQVASEVGIGTTFRVRFPAVASTPTRVVAQEPASRGGTESVLLVEDEVSVRRLGRIALEANGYTVHEAGNGREALQVASRIPSVQLLLTDVVMPEMGGRELAKILREKLPGLRVLYTSGYTSEEVVMREGNVKATDAFLQKPYTPLSLARKVREVLDIPH